MNTSQPHPKIIKFLLVSDTHMNTDKIQELLDHYKIQENGQNKPKFDYILHSGDFDNLSCQQALEEEQQQNSLLNIGFSLRMLERFNIPILFVPGNHDPISVFQQDYKMRVSKSTINIHKRIQKLQQNLYILGLGGSIPISQLQRNGKTQQKFSSFPWKSQNQFRKELMMQYQNAQQQSQIILLSHIGPLSSSTTIQTQFCVQNKQVGNLQEIDQQQKIDYPCRQPGILYTGSKAIDDLVIHNQNMLLNIHGHTHIQSTSKMGKCSTTILGPGSLDDGYFAELNLIQLNQRWKVKSIELIRI